MTVTDSKPIVIGADDAGLGLKDVIKRYLDDRGVAYDDVGGWVAARLWWMLDNLGHRQVRVLDGGFPAWTAAGLPVTKEEPSWPEARLDLANEWTAVVDRDGLCPGALAVLRVDRAARQREVGDGGLLLVDRVRRLLRAACQDRRRERGRAGEDADREPQRRSHGVRHW